MQAIHFAIKRTKDYKLHHDVDILNQKSFSPLAIEFLFSSKNIVSNRLSGHVDRYYTRSDHVT